MLVDKNESLESRNFLDGVDFSSDDPCIFVVYPPGASGDLLISIIDKHYLRTGCEYYGIDNNGKLHYYTTDYEQIDSLLEKEVGQQFKFDQQFFWKIAESLGRRNLNYSLLDQVIFGCHMFKDDQIANIINTFPKAQVIRIVPHDDIANELIHDLILKKGPIKNSNTVTKERKEKFLFKHDRVLEISFGSLFNKTNYYKTYDQIIKFLNLKGRLIHYDYIKYYISKQDPAIAKRLTEYSRTLNV